MTFLPMCLQSVYNTFLFYIPEFDIILTDSSVSDKMKSLRPL